MISRFAKLFAWMLAIGSCALLIIATLAYATRPDWCAAATFIPAWIWSLVGISWALVCAYNSKRLACGLFVGWMIFTGWFVEEVKSIAQHNRANRKSDLDHNEQTLLVISLNCAGGNMNAARQLAAYKPDVVFLQERPSDLNDIRKLADELCGANSVLCLGTDTAVIARCTLISDVISDDTHGFLSHAAGSHGERKNRRSLLNSSSATSDQHGSAESRMLGKSCARSTRTRRSQLRKAIIEFDKSPKDTSLIIGGDFNVPGHDGSLNELKKKFQDGFSQGGWGLGNTAINNLPLFRIDQIWCSKSIRTEFVSAIQSQHSDHRIVIGYYRLPE